MNNEKEILDLKKLESKDDNVLRAVYALNMCTVSVSQIIDYNDVYILEQEYDAILNNLNLEKMPKADALKNILVQLLNTITFFRIQEIRKDAIEKKYQQKMKNAIWSAIPNLNVIVAGGPAAIAFSLATQVGIGYMNYRKEKNNVLSEKEKEELELRITAIEQFNALRRELFTTAWELAEEYEFDDRLRLTEKQIKQYNEILKDQDELRKYVRLEAIQDKFEAFPPFWYFFGHTAAYIAGNKVIKLEDWEREEYKRRAKEHFGEYEKLNKFNILREDQMTASFALEYIDLLLPEKDIYQEKIDELIKIANEMSGNDLDVKELCAIAYLKIGETEKAGRILKQLVNESYNTITNAKLLSRIYVSQFLNGNSKTAKFDYKTLSLRIGEDSADYLFPMPNNVVGDKQLQLEYLVDQKILLQMDYSTAISELSEQYTIKFNAIIPAPFEYNSLEEYYCNSEKAVSKRMDDMKKVLNNPESKQRYIDKIESIGIRFRYVDLINEVMENCDELDVWKQSENHDFLTSSVRANLVLKRTFLNKLQKRIDENNFDINCFNELQQNINFKELMGRMIDDLKTTVFDAIDKCNTLEKVEMMDYNLAIFCKKNQIKLKGSKISDSNYKQNVKDYLDYDIFGKDGINEENRKDCIKKMKQLIKEVSNDLVIGAPSQIAIIHANTDEFNLYFNNIKLQTGGLKNKTLAIIDDKTMKNSDLVLTNEGLLLIHKNEIKSLHSYRDVNYSKSAGSREVLVIGWPNEYVNKNVNIGVLYNLIKKLNEVSYKKN